jgi:hypothetical protein
MLRPLAILAGILLVLLALLTGKEMPGEYRLAHALASAGTALALVAALAHAARQRTHMRLRTAVGVAWIGGIVVAIVGAAVTSLTAYAIGSAFGIALIVGFVVALGATWLLYGIRPALFRPRAMPSMADALE